MAVSHVKPDRRQVVSRHLLDVKFREGSTIRLRGGRPADLHGDALSSQRVTAAFSQLRAAAWTRRLAVPEETLDRLRAGGTRPNGRPLPDLNLWFRLELPPDLDAADVARMLRDLEVIECVEPVATTAPEMFDAPDFSVPAPGVEDWRYQAYLDPAPMGIDARYAWRAWDLHGEGVRICDVEYGWDPLHHDLPNVTLTGAQQELIFPSPYTDNHGTAVIGIYGGVDNGKGVRGIAHGATMLFAAAGRTGNGEATSDLMAAIVDACVALDAGDVMLLELGAWGPGPDPDEVIDLPPSWNRGNYDAIVTAVGNRIVVVEPAGNAGQTLDDSRYVQDPPGHRPFVSAWDRVADEDSGSIMVGASEGYGNLSTWASSNAGARVNLFGWGFSIVTAVGSTRPVPDAIAVIYDEYVPPDGDAHAAFASNMGGTSGAAAIVAGAAALLQSYVKRYHGTTLGPVAMRTVLWRAGTPPSSGLIGRMPDLRRAIESLLSLFEHHVPAPVFTPPAATIIGPSPTGSEAIRVRIDFAPGDTGEGEIRYATTPDVTGTSMRFDPSDATAGIPVYSTQTLYARVFRRHEPDGTWTRGQLATASYIVATEAGSGCRSAALLIVGLGVSAAALVLTLVLW